MISGNSSDGILISGAGASGNAAEGNFIGTDATGSNPLSNGGNGIGITEHPDNTIGGTVTGTRDLYFG